MSPEKNQIEGRKAEMEHTKVEQTPEPLILVSLKIQILLKTHNTGIRESGFYTSDHILTLSVE